LTHCAAIVSTVAFSNGSVGAAFGDFVDGRELVFFGGCVAGGFASGGVLFCALTAVVNDVIKIAVIKRLFSIQVSPIRYKFVGFETKF
jgi:hypothetical protein